MANRYLLLLAYISASDSARPVYSTMHRPFPIGSAVKSPRPVRERLTTSAYSPVANFRFATRIFLSPDCTFRSHADYQHLAARAISRKQNPLSTLSRATRRSGKSGSAMMNAVSHHFEVPSTCAVARVRVADSPGGQFGTVFARPIA
jgi:hypothetical protein